MSVAFLFPLFCSFNPLCPCPIFFLCDCQLSVNLSREQGGLGKQSLLYSQVLERENNCKLRGGHMGGGPGKWVQPSRWGAKRGDPWTRWTSTFMEGQNGIHKKRHEGLSLMHENVTGSQAEKGPCGQAHLITWVHLVT